MRRPRVEPIPLDAVVTYLDRRSGNTRTALGTGTTCYRGRRHLLTTPGEYAPPYVFYVSPDNIRSVDGPPE